MFDKLMDADTISCFKDKHSDLFPALEKEDLEFSGKGGCILGNVMVPDLGHSSQGSFLLDS